MPGCVAGPGVRAWFGDYAAVPLIVSYPPHVVPARLAELAELSRSAGHSPAVVYGPLLTVTVPIHPIACAVSFQVRATAATTEPGSPRPPTCSFSCSSHRSSTVQGRPRCAVTCTGGLLWTPREPEQRTLNPRVYYPNRPRRAVQLHGPFRYPKLILIGFHGAGLEADLVSPGHVPQPIGYDVAAARADGSPAAAGSGSRASLPSRAAGAGSGLLTTTSRGRTRRTRPSPRGGARVAGGENARVPAGFSWHGCGRCESSRAAANLSRAIKQGERTPAEATQFITAMLMLPLGEDVAGGGVPDCAEHQQWAGGSHDGGVRFGERNGSGRPLPAALRRGLQDRLELVDLGNVPEQQAGDSQYSVRDEDAAGFKADDPEQSDGPSCAWLSPVVACGVTMPDTCRTSGRRSRPRRPGRLGQRS